MDYRLRASAAVSTRGGKMQAVRLVSLPLLQVLPAQFQGLWARSPTEARCPICGALERHRLMHLYAAGNGPVQRASEEDVARGSRTELSRWFRKAANIDYVSADLFKRDAMVRMDICDIQYPDNTFDVIYCSHVLEHVPDDRKAMREFLRVLKVGGWAILQVPITSHVTFEDPSVSSPKKGSGYCRARSRRRYGPDYRDRLVDAGFSVTVDGLCENSTSGRPAAVV